jgi:hypothetical protein
MWTTILTIILLFLIYVMTDSLARKNRNLQKENKELRKQVKE